MNNTFQSQICIYDGITLFVRDPAFFYTLTKDPEKYKLQIRVDLSTGLEQQGIEGKWRNFDIYSSTNSRGPGIVIGGSLHKFKNRSFNYDSFFMDEFVQVYTEILEEFKFDPQQTDIWELEGGLNNVLPEFGFKAKDYPKNTIILKGNPKQSTLKRYERKSYSLKITKGECSYKFYDKSTQFNLPYEVVRTECSCKRRPLAKIGFRNFSDLINVEYHRNYALFLLKIYENIIIFQPEILNNPLIKEGDKRFFMEYRNASSWISTKQKSNYQFKKTADKFDNLINTYADFNYKKELISLMRSSIL